MKGLTVTLVGCEGNEGKSFVLRPLQQLYRVFNTPSQGNFPLYGLPDSQVIFLDDWRFGGQIVSWNTQLLLLEGAPVQVAMPQNQARGHITFTGSSPVFLTTLESDLVTPKPGIQPGDLAMLRKRLTVFRFHHVQENPDRSLKPCVACWAQFILGRGNRERAIERALEHPDPLKPVHLWNVADVIQWLEELQLQHVSESFRTDAVDGNMLLQLGHEDFVNHLHLTELQTRKILRSLSALR